MTIKVYKVGSDGRRRPARPTVSVPKGDRERLPESLAYPPCQCGRCSDGRAS